MKRIITTITNILLILVCLSFTMPCIARTKDFDKNTKIVDSKDIEITARQFDCQIAFTILIDSETSRQDVSLKFVFFAKKTSAIDVNGNLLLGCKGEADSIINLLFGRNYMFCLSDSYKIF